VKHHPAGHINLYPERLDPPGMLFASIRDALRLPSGLCGHYGILLG